MASYNKETECMYSIVLKKTDREKLELFAKNNGHKTLSGYVRERLGL